MSATIKLEEKKLKVIGTRPVRPDGVPKVTGLARYGADYFLPGMLWGKILRSPHAHARIRSIDTSQAQALLKHPGYTAPLRKNQGRGVASGFWFNAIGRRITELPMSPPKVLAALDSARGS